MNNTVHGNLTVAMGVLRLDSPLDFRLQYPTKLRDVPKLAWFLNFKPKGVNPQRVSTEIIIEIKQLSSGRMASHASIESVWCSH